jgi:hypothetical protein
MYPQGRPEVHASGEKDSGWPLYDQPEADSNAQALRSCPGTADSKCPSPQALRREE